MLWWYRHRYTSYAVRAFSARARQRDEPLLARKTQQVVFIRSSERPIIGQSSL